MANLTRSAKSPGDWTFYDVEAYNIHLECQQPLEFFGVPHLPPPAVDQEVLQHVEAEEMSQDQNVGLIHLLDSAMLGSSHGETAVADFAVELLKHTGYVRRDRVARTRAGLPLLVCGERGRAQVDVCVIDHGQGNEILLLVQEDRWSVDKHLVDANAQLVAKAISAFMMNNFNRQSADLPVLESKVRAAYLFQPR
ncbi:hypothetical protein NMY22_g19039 [Coprinellus aureogranulatus]|nr:hypothetical protein NMY22_g19039 [Coprinellus aureogranulatus]